MEYDVIIIGGGPAGMYTALSLSEQGVSSILVLDLKEELGGNLNDIIEVDESFEIEGYTGVEMADDLKRKLILHGIDYETKAYVLSAEREEERKRLKVVSPSHGLYSLSAKALVFATGARERPRGILNFTSRRTTGILSVGTARKFIVEEGYLPGSQLVIYGSDWTGLYLARLLKTEGAREITIVDQVREIRYPQGILEEFHRLHDIRLELGWTITDIHGQDRITGVTLERTGKNHDGAKTRELACDTVLLSVGLSPQRGMFRKFRRNPAEKGLFLTGNAEEISFDLRDIRKRAQLTASKVLDYLSASHGDDEA